MITKKKRDERKVILRNWVAEQILCGGKTARAFSHLSCTMLGFVTMRRPEGRSVFVGGIIGNPGDGLDRCISCDKEIDVYTQEDCLFSHMLTNRYCRGKE